MRLKLSSLLTLALMMLAVPVAPAAAQQEDGVYRFQGGGWGHGVGMSQYGAYGQALEGRTYDQILGHYYQGTALAQLDSLVLRSDALTAVEDALWVGIDQNQTSMSFEAIGGQLDLCQANDGTGPCPRPEHPQPGESWRLDKVNGGCRFSRNGVEVGPQPGDCRVSISWDDATTRIKLNGRDYAYGTVKIRSDGVGGGNFHVSLAIDLEKYVRGIAEMPQSWASEALKTQAVASRTYAVYRFLTLERPDLRTASDAGLTLGQKTLCWCHVRDTVSDQVYLGYASETGTNSANWLAAVESTAGQVVTYTGADWPSFTRDRVIGAFYFSSSHGMTETNIGGFGSTVQYPYLLSVDDHWSSNPGLNPNAYWEKDVTAATIAAALGWDQVTLVDLLNGAPGASVTFTGISNGSTVSVTKGGAWMRSNLKLASPHVTGLVGDPEGVPQGAEEPVVVVHPFVDLEGNPHEAAISTIWQVGITQGCTGDEYCPAEAVARWQMALFLMRLWPLTGFDQPAGVDQGFEDLDGMSPEAVFAINRLVELGISTGVSEMEFSPTSDVTRWQMALFLTRLVNAAGFPMPDGSDQGFTDIADLPAGTQKAINQLRQMGITLGTSTTQFSPSPSVRRDEMASFLSRTLELVGLGN
jgi:SpoIID/LytB domain protein